jgi:hypothetical protein
MSCVDCLWHETVLGQGAGCLPQGICGEGHRSRIDLVRIKGVEKTKTFKVKIYIAMRPGVVPGPKGVRRVGL